MDFVAASDLATCGECGLEGPLGKIQEHFLEHYNYSPASPTSPPEIQGNQKGSDVCVEDQADSMSPSTPMMATDESDEGDKLWPASTVLLLIRLVESNYSSFDNTMKKIVWQKIASELSKATNNKTFTAEQVDTKWKGLKRTYKKIKDHNSKTGKNRKSWQFYDAMDSFLYEKPEYEAPATCSSTKGLIVNTEHRKENEPVTPKTSKDDSSGKRKNENSVERRHKEKIKRLDRFLDLYQVAVEHQIGQKINRDEESD